LRDANVKTGIDWSSVANYWMGNADLLHNPSINEMLCPM